MQKSRVVNAPFFPRITIDGSKGDLFRAHGLGRPPARVRCRPLQAWRHWRDTAKPFIIHVRASRKRSGGPGNPRPGTCRSLAIFSAFPAQLTVAARVGWLCREAARNKRAAGASSYREISLACARASAGLRGRDMGQAGLVLRNSALPLRTLPTE